MYTYTNYSFTSLCVRHDQQNVFGYFCAGRKDGTNTRRQNIVKDIEIILERINST